MNKTIIQVPVDQALRVKADKKAQEMGFSSLQETIRVFLVQLADGAYHVTISPKPVKLSQKAIARYNKMIDEAGDGEMISQPFAKVSDMMEYLSA